MKNNRREFQRGDRVVVLRGNGGRGKERVEGGARGAITNKEGKDFFRVEIDGHKENPFYFRHREMMLEKDHAEAGGGQ